MSIRENLYLHRAARGDRDALEQLVKLYYDKIYNYIYYRVNHPALAEDLTQEVFMRLTRRMGEDFQTTSFAAYLYRMAHNALVDYYRHSALPEILPETSPPTDEISALEKRMDVAWMLRTLPENQRECIVLFYMQELSFREIGQVLDIPIPTAKSRVQRGLKTLKKMMEEVP